MKKTISQVILNIYGILDIIMGILVLGLAALIYFGIGEEEITGVLSQNETLAKLSATGFIILFVIIAVILLIVGILACRAYKDCHHSLGIWILTLISAVSSAGTLFFAYRKVGTFDFASLSTEIISFAFSLILFIAASCVRGQAKKG